MNNVAQDLKTARLALSLVQRSLRANPRQNTYGGDSYREWERKLLARIEALEAQAVAA